MLGDLLSALNYFRKVDSNAPETTLGKGRKVVRNYAPMLALLIVAGIAFGFLKFPDGALLSAYAAAPFVLDSTIFLESLPLLGRVAPRATIIVEMGMELGAVGAGISLSIVYTVYRKIGAAAMTVSWFDWKRNN